MSKKKPAKRVDIITLKMVKETSILYENRKVTSPQEAANLVSPFLESCDREKFVVVCLDVKNQPANISVVSVGTVNSSLIHPRELFKVAILSNASNIIISHNHPSGDPTPSHEDIAITKKLVEAGEIMGISIMDHIVIGSDVNTFISFKERGLF